MLEAVALVNAVGEELAASPFAHQIQSRPLERIMAATEAEAERRGVLGRAWAQRAGRVDRAALPDALALGVTLAGVTAERLAREDGWYWHVHDPLGLGFFGLFGPTAYCGGWQLSVVAHLLARHRFETAGDGERYLGLVADVASLVRSMRDRLEGQAARGIVMPAAQLAQAKVLTAAIGARTGAQLLADPVRYAALPRPAAFRDRMHALVEGELAAAFRDLGACLEGSYGDGAGARVGMGQYSGGDEIYAQLVRLHTTLDLAPDEVHAIGRSRIAGIREQMAELRAEVGFTGSDVEFRTAISADRRWREDDADGVAARFQESLDRVRPFLDQWLRLRPQAPCGIAPLPDALSASMTFGYYQAAASASDTGRYLFNAANLIRSGLANVPALTFHELLPGHHVHLASQAENPLLPALSRHNSFNAYNEGWAEYAATLAGQHGLYRTPEERFGRLMMDAFLTSRLVVDTGMNALGWSLDEARAYLYENGFMNEHEVRTESIRYACDLPAQALAYKLGDTFLIQQRERMRAALGARFDLRDFHDAVLEFGALPLPLVAERIDRAITRLAS